MFQLDRKRAEALVEYAYKNLDEVRYLAQCITYFAREFAETTYRYDDFCEDHKNMVVLHLLTMFAGFVTFNRDAVEDIIRIIRLEERDFDTLIRTLKHDGAYHDGNS